MTNKLILYCCIVFLSLFVLLLIGCKSKTKQIEILVENSSNVNDSINIDLIVNDIFYKKVPVKRGKETIKYEKIEMDFPKDESVIHLKFKLNSTGELAESIVKKDSIKGKAIVHVNFLEVRFNKGFELGNRVLEKDSIVRREFYSEIMY